MNEKTQSKSHLGSCPLLDSIQGGNWIQKRALDSNWIQKRVCDNFEALITMMTKTLIFSDVLIVIDVVIGDLVAGNYMNIERSLPTLADNTLSINRSW